MRIIPDEILDMVAGGRKFTASATGTTPVITVVGTPPPPDPDPEPPITLPEQPPPSSGGGGGGGGAHHSSPAPLYAPNVQSMDQLRNAVLDLATQIKVLTNSDREEHGAFIIRSADGSLHAGPIATGYTDVNGIHRVDENAILGAGETVVAIVHSHPVVPNTDEREPSNFDSDELHDFVKKDHADPNTLTYIVDMESGDTFEYDRSITTNLTVPGPNISKDY